MLASTTKNKKTAEMENLTTDSKLLSELLGLENAKITEIKLQF